MRRFPAMLVLLGCLLLNTVAAGVAEQDEKPVTISGTAIAADGTPVEGLKVRVEVALRLYETSQDGGGRPPSHGMLDLQTRPTSRPIFETVATGTTDIDGRFSLKFIPKGVKPDVAIVFIGDHRKTRWYVAAVEHKGRDVDLGRLELKPPAR